MLACLVVALGGLVLLAARGAGPVAAVYGRPGATTSTTVERGGTEGSLVGQAFPGFAGISLLDGRPLATTETGTYVLVAWTPDCDCSAMFSAMNAAMAQAGEDVTWIGIVTAGDVESAARRAYEGSHLFPSALDPSGSVSEMLGEQGSPGVLVVDGGKVVAEFGPDVSAEDVLSHTQDGRD